VAWIGDSLGPKFRCPRLLSFFWGFGNGTRERSGEMARRCGNGCVAGGGGGAGGGLVGGGRERFSWSSTVAVPV
jgi:hypothetical protein